MPRCSKTKIAAIALLWLSMYPSDAVQGQKNARELVRSSRRSTVSINGKGKIIPKAEMADVSFHSAGTAAVTMDSHGNAEDNRKWHGNGAGNCAGSISIEAKYCRGADLAQISRCNHSAVPVDTNVPLRIKLKNSFKNGDGTAIPGVLRSGKHIQIVFACNDQPCEDVPEDQVFEYESLTHAPRGPQDSTFTMGVAPDATDDNPCSELHNADTACGYITIGSNFHVDADEWIVIGVLNMKAVNKVQGTLYAYVISEPGLFETEGGLCGPPELSSKETLGIGSSFQFA